MYKDFKQDVTFSPWGVGLDLLGVFTIIFLPKMLTPLSH